MNVKIVPATALDAKSLVVIQQQAFKRLYDIYHDEGSPYLRGTDEIIGWLERPNWQVYKIIADGVLCGGVSFCERHEMPGEYYLARIYITPELQSKGIASTAISLCEATVFNANRWTLDFPVDQIANRRCYEKAGYMDTGETREQSGGAITLAYMEKKIPAFRNIKSQLDNPTVHKLISYCAFEESMELAAKDVEDYKRIDSIELWGWVEKGTIIGICGYRIEADHIDLMQISVTEDARYRGIGGAMITALQEKYKMAIEAETDDDAVEFYCKTGFVTTAIQKYDVRRWTCVKSTPKPIEKETDEERQARIYPIILSEYNPEWPQWYVEERDNLVRLVGDSIVHIQHIGSTAVPGLLAKPTVDILLEVPVGTDIDKIIALFQQYPEYICLYGEGLTNKNEPLCIIKGYTDTGFAEKVYHIHVRETGNYDEPIFRDYLIAHFEAAAEYAALKLKLKDRFEHDRDGYTAAKGEFISEVMKKAKEKQ